MSVSESAIIKKFLDFEGAELLWHKIMNSINNELKQIKIVNTTYNELKALKDNNKLIPGWLYCITDYTTTATGKNVTVANHRFDIVVNALNENTLSENAYARTHEGESYFNNCDLSSWTIKYCFDNDTSRFEWADTKNGKGVIYYLKDEYNNECHYDFKNILINKLYTFSYTIKNIIYDGTVYNPAKCYYNRIESYKTGIKYKLNLITFENTTQNDSCYFNTFETDCHNISFKENCNNNHFDNGCSNITLDGYCSNNKVGFNSTDNILGFACSSNTFGTYFCNNELGTYCRYNVFGHVCNNNTLGNYYESNIFGNNCDYVKFSADETGEIILNNVSNITVGNNCKNLIIWTDSEVNSENPLRNYIISSFVSGVIELEGMTTTNRNYTTKISTSSRNKTVQYCETDIFAKNNVEVSVTGSDAVFTNNARVENDNLILEGDNIEIVNGNLIINK